MRFNLIEIKIRMVDDLRDWNKIEVMATEVIPDSSIDQCLKYHADLSSDHYGKAVKEIRWNYLGSLQGHYYTPKSSQ